MKRLIFLTASLLFAFLANAQTPTATITKQVIFKTLASDTTAIRTGAFEGTLFWNPVSNKVRWFDGTSWNSVGSGSGGVLSVFGRTGNVTAATNDYTFSQIGSKPTSLSGYGITDPIVLTSGSYSNPSWITGLAWSKISSTPTSLSGYGIADPIVLTSGSYSNPSWITGLSWSKISSTPTSLSGYGIADPIVLTSGSYSNPSWITGLSWSKISSTPTTISGYGITDASASLGSPSTSSSTITLDFSSAYEKRFVGAASFATAKTMALSNTTNAYVFDFTFVITNVAATLSFPTGWGMSDLNFISGTGVWTPPSTGTYEMSGYYNGTNWFVKIGGPYSFH